VTAFLPHVADVAPGAEAEFIFGRSSSGARTKLIRRKLSAKRDFRRLWPAEAEVACSNHAGRIDGFLRRLLATGAETRRVASAPDHLTLKRHRDLEGHYTTGIVVRRIAFMLLGIVALLGLLNVFGQRPSGKTAEGAAAKLELYAPLHVRGGLLYMARFRVTAKQDVKDATLVLAPGWAENITINTIEPAPVGEASKNGRLSFDLGHIPAGESFVLFMQFQVNPTNVGRRSQDVELLDGDKHITTLDRTVTVFP